MTRGEWYTKRFGGGWRAARKARKCGRFGCFDTIHANDRYFDTAVTDSHMWPKTLCICAKCANEELKEPPP